MSTSRRHIWWFAPMPSKGESFICVCIDCLNKFEEITRMHSSKMRTDRCSARHQMSVSGVWCHFLSGPMFIPGWGLPQGGSLPPPHPVDRQTLLKTLPPLAAGNNIVLRMVSCRRCRFCSFRPPTNLVFSRKELDSFLKDYFMWVCVSVRIQSYLNTELYHLCLKAWIRDLFKFAQNGQAWIQEVCKP